MMRNILALLGFLAICAAAAVAISARWHPERSPIYAPPERLAVDYLDLDLTSRRGRRTLDRRIRYAMRSVCNDYATRDLAEQARIKRCIRKAMKGTRPQVEFAVQQAYTRQQGYAVAPPPPPHRRWDAPPPPRTHGAAMQHPVAHPVYEEPITTTELPPSEPGYQGW